VEENTAVVSPAFATDAARTDTASTTGNTTGKPAEKKDDASSAGLEDNFPESQVATPIVKTIEEPGVIATAASNTYTATSNTSNATSNTSDVTAQATAQQPQRAVIEGSHLEIHRRDQLHRERYMKTMKAMRAGNWRQAMLENEALLAAEGLTPELHKKALGNKLRIYLEQKRFAEFLEFYRQKNTQPEIQRSEIWLTTVAPGLHIVGAYEEAIDSYRLLSKLQPQVSNWPIAMALALEENQQADQARRVLSDLLQQYSLPTSQRQWVEQKLASLR
jgi:tetratricopeptide (TPR) repeat protein